MSNYQKTIIMGRLGADPETKYFGDGSSVTSFDIASSEQWKDRATGERMERVLWMKCNCFGRLSEIAAQFLKKGSLALVEGKLNPEKWKDNATGQERRSISLRVAELKLMDRKPDDGNESKPSTAPASGAGQAQQNFDDDIPF